MKIYKIPFITLFIITVLALILYSSFSNKQIYGNDRQSIMKVIQSLDGQENNSINILEIKDIGNDRIVSFLDNNKPAYILFVKNKKENYEWRFKTGSNAPFATFFEHLRSIGNDKAVFWVVTNNQNDIAKLELVVNDERIVQEFSVNQNSVTWIDLPDSDGSYKFKYNYFDRDGNLLEN